MLYVLFFCRMEKLSCIFLIVGQSNPKLPSPCRSSKSKMATMAPYRSQAAIRGTTKEGDVCPILMGKGTGLSIGSSGHFELLILLVHT